MRKLAIVLLLGLLLPSAQAQICSNFETPTIAPWTTTSAVGTIQTPGVSSAQYAHVADGGGGSWFVAPVAYRGNWLTLLNGCGALCFDVQLIQNGAPGTTPAPLSIQISGPGGTASFLTTPLPEGQWRCICVPVRAGAAPPASTNGSWSLTSGNWNNLLASVTSLRFAIDIGTTIGNGERWGFDNICLQPSTVTPPVIVGPPSTCITPATYCVAQPQTGVTYSWTVTTGTTTPATGTCTTATFPASGGWITVTGPDSFGCSRSARTEVKPCNTGLPPACCDGQITIPNLTVTSTTNPNVYNVGATINGFPTAQRVQLTLIGASVSYTVPTCGTTHATESYFASASNLGSIAPVMLVPFSREVYWPGPLTLPATFQGQFTVPPVNGSCEDTLQLCFRATVTSPPPGCRTCERIRCVNVTRNNCNPSCTLIVKPGDVTPPVN